MALVVYDRVQQTGTANTTVSFTLSGSVTGFQSFAVVGNGNTTYYAATDASGNWEVGLGTYSTTGPTLTRTTILSSSNSGSAVTFSGTCNVFLTYPSGKSVYEDASGNVSPLGTIASGVWNGTTIGVAYGGTGVTTSSGANSVVLRDANQNVTFNNFTPNAVAVTAAAGTTILTAASARTQILVGSTTQTFQLPNATTLVLGQSFLFVNNSSGVLTVTDNASATVELVPSGGVTQLGATSIATSAGTWGPYSFIPAAANWGTNSLALASTVISGGTWQGGTIQSGYGGTGLTTFAAANNALYSTSASALAAGTLPVAAGGTGMTTATTNGVFYGNGTSAHGVTAAGTTGQVLIGNTGAAPSWGTVSSSLVSSLNFGTTGLTPATATTGAITVAGTLVAANGGTGQSSYAVGDLLYASTTTALSKLADVATGNALISGGIGVAPSYGKIGLTTHVSGTLAVGNGGTGLTSLTTGYIPFGAGTSAFGNSVNLFWDNTNARLGIGNSSPAYKLDVATIAVAVSQSGGVRFGASDQYGFRLNQYTTGGGVPYAQIMGPQDSNGWLAFTQGTADAERMRIHGTGGVSIGNTTDPGATNLSVTGTIASASTVSGTRLISTVAIGTAPLTVTSTTQVANLNAATAGTATNQSGGTVSATTLAASGVATFSAGTVSLPAITTTGDTNTGIFFPAADTIAFTEGGAEAMRINSSGYVGIGTTNPTSGLVVAAGMPNTPSTVGVHIGTQTTYAAIEMAAVTGTLIDFTSTGVDYKGRIYYDNTSNYMSFGANSAERMRLHSSGGLSLGNTTDPGATNLSVTGSVTATNGLVATSTAPFVLNATTVSANYTSPANYNLMSAGPITINTSITVTIDTTGTWTVI